MSAKRPAQSGVKTRRVVWTARALADVEAIGDYIARDNPNAAERWVTRLLKAAQRTGAMPFAGRRVPEVARDDVREVVVRNYRLVYRVAPTCVAILTVFESHRTFPGGADDE